MKTTCIRTLLQRSVAFFTAGCVALLLAGSARAADGDSAAKRLVREFNLVPKLLSGSKGQSGDNPLRTISRRMTVVHEDLTQMQTNEPVQTREKQVVQSLDELIAALQKKCSGNGGHTPGTGRKESVIVKGSTNFGDLHGVDPNAKLWNQLPAKLRNEILQSKTDGFPPGYEALLQSYYQQLAEEKSLDDKPVKSSEKK